MVTEFLKKNISHASVKWSADDKFISGHTITMLCLSTTIVTDTDQNV